MLCSNNSVKANFISNYKKSADVSCFVVHLTFHSYSLLFSRIPSSKNDRQPSYYSEDSNLNSSCSKFVVLQHKNSKYVGKSKIILRLNGLKNTKQRTKLFIWNSYIYNSITSPHSFHPHLGTCRTVTLVYVVPLQRTVPPSYAAKSVSCFGTHRAQNLW